MGKLVRDNIDKLIQSSGKNPVIKILDDSEYKRELDKKLQEEVTEYLAENNLEELADIIEVVYALTNNLGYTVADLYEYREAKARKNGKFKDKKYLVEVK